MIAAVYFQTKEKPGLSSQTILGKKIILMLKIERKNF